MIFLPARSCGFPDADPECYITKDMTWMVAPVREDDVITAWALTRLGRGRVIRTDSYDTLQQALDACKGEI